MSRAWRIAEEIVRTFVVAVFTLGAVASLVVLMAMSR